MYIFRTDENPFGSCQPCSNNIHITYDDNTSAHRAACGAILRKKTNTRETQKNLHGKPNIFFLVRSIQGVSKKTEQI